jgi:protein-tyrosine phosphatase
MAAALLRRRIAELGLTDQVQVESAGVWAEAGDAASPSAVEVLSQRGIQLEGHRSQPVTSSLLERADIVLVMEEAHRRSLFYLAPEYLGKVFLLTEMVGQHENIGDPYGGPNEAYVATVEQIEKTIGDGLLGILQRIGIRNRSAE